MSPAPSDPICFDCWLAQDDERVPPKHLEQDGESVMDGGRAYLPWRCAWCEQRWLTIRETGSPECRYLACSRGDAGPLQTPDRHKGSFKHLPADPARIQ